MHCFKYDHPEDGVRCSHVALPLPISCLLGTMQQLSKWLVPQQKF